MTAPSRPSRRSRSARPTPCPSPAPAGSTAASPRSCSRKLQGARLCRRTSAAARPRRDAAREPAASGDADRPDRRARDRRFDRRHPCARRPVPRAAARIGVPILVTQHLPIPFMQRVRAPARRGRPARGAWSPRTGWRSTPDRILLAPGDAHLTLEPAPTGAVVRLTHGRSTSGCMPSVDPMFASVGADLRRAARSASC